MHDRRHGVERTRDAGCGRRIREIEPATVVLLLRLDRLEELGGRHVCAGDRVGVAVHEYASGLHGSPLLRSKTALKFEIHGSGSYANQASLDAALDFHNAITPRAIEARDRYLAARVRAGLHETPGVELHASDDPALGCGLVAFKLRNVATVELNDLLWDRHRIYIRNVTHPEIGWDINRASLHIMVNANQVDNFIGAVEEIAKESRS